MSTLIALDIDCVLLPWDDESYMARQDSKRTTYDRWGHETGFKDWRKVEKKYFTFVSKDQLDLIQQVGDIYWLTTWGKHDMTATFEAELDLPSLPIIRPRDWTAAEYVYKWWKAGWLWMWIRENHERVAKYDRVLWVDDDHYPDATSDCLGEIEYELAQLGTELVIIQPMKSVWSREEIERWLPET